MGASGLEAGERVRGEREKRGREKEEKDTQSKREGDGDE